MRGRNRFAISLGDSLENVIPGDDKHNSMVWDSDMTPDEQFREAADYWRPLAEARKLLWDMDSNHNWRTEAKVGRSIGRELNVFLQGQYDGKSQKLTTPHPDKLPRWGGWQALNKLHVGKNEYIIHSWHGSGGGATPESALRRCRSMAEQHNAQVFLMGHFHNRLFWQDNRMEFSANGMNARECQRTFAVTGGYLGWHDTYAERAGLRPNRRGAIVLKLGARDWDVKVSM